MIDISDIPDPTLKALIDLVRAHRSITMQVVADRIQFGQDGVNEFDGHRCRFCEQLVGGDRTHRCWENL
jgi:hypothetical protein